MCRLMVAAQDVYSMNPKQRKNRASLILLVVMLLLYFLFFRKNNNNGNASRDDQYTTTSKSDKRQKKFRQHAVYYTKHALCRMDCRQIDSSEVREILADGEINYAKSDLKSSPCPKYALEGITHDKQRVRVIVGDCDSRASIVTVIDLDHEFECDCK